ncbi:MAG: hypothetical protein ACYDGM_08430 [Vulcanimicrobiaceae bacterium]
MIRSFWRWAIAATVLVCVGFSVASLLLSPTPGTYGLDTSGSFQSATVASVRPHSPAQRAGIHPGDRLTFDRTLDARIHELPTIAPGDRLTVHRAGLPDVTLVAVPVSSMPWVMIIIADTTRGGFLLLASVLAWRRPRDTAAMLLASFAASFALGMSIDATLFSASPVRLALYMATEIAFVVAGAFAVLFACTFPRPAIGGVRKFLYRIALPLCALAVAGSIVRLTSVFVYGWYAVWMTDIFLAVWVTYIIAVPVAIFASLRVAEPTDRAKLRWMLLTFAVGFSGLFVYFLGVALQVQQQALQYATITVIAIPFGLGYVILRHRLLDIGFVINRAVVYGAVSLVVIALFVGLEWGIGHVVEARSNASVALQLAGALLLGLSVRVIHTRVDRVVDDLFFRDRHRAEAAIRRFAREATLVTELDALIAKTVDVAQRNVRLRAATLYGREGERYLLLGSSAADLAQPEADENDDAVLAMRTWHEPIELSGVHTQLEGELALPMTVRGQLAGFLLCGPKISGEAIAPDEREALRLLAHDVGFALDSLRVAALERELVGFRNRATARPSAATGGGRATLYPIGVDQPGV